MGLLDNKAIGERLRKYRSGKGYKSARSFATDIGFDQSQYSKIESGNLGISDGLITKILKKHSDFKKEEILGIKLPSSVDIETDAGKLTEMIIQLRASMNVVESMVVSLTSKVEKTSLASVISEMNKVRSLEADRLFDEYARKAK